MERRRPMLQTASERRAPIPEPAGAAPPAPELGGQEAAPGGRIQFGIRGRQVVTVALAALAVALATSVVSAAILARTKLANAREQAELIALLLYHQSSQVIRQHAPEDLRSALAGSESLRSLADAVVGYSPTLLHVAIVDDRGTFVFHSDPLQQGRHPPLAPSLVQLSEQHPVAQVWALARPQGAIVLDLPFAVDPRAPSFSVQVAVSALLLRRDLLTGVFTNALLATVVVLIAFLGSFGLAQRMLAPYEMLRRQLARLDLGRDQPPLDLRTEADVGRVAEFFDSLSRRLATDHAAREGLSLNALLAGLDDAVIVLGAGGAILSLNDSARKILGVRDNPSEMHLEDLLPPSHPFRIAVREILEQRRPGTMRSVALMVRGERVEYLLTTHLLGEEHRLRGVLLTARDQRQLTRLASQLSYAQKLAALGRLTSGVAHQIKNPLNAMAVHVGLLRKRIGSSAPESRRYLDVLDEELRRLDRVVKGFLDFSRPEEVTLQPVELGEVLRGVVSQTLPRAEASRVHVDLRVRPDLPPVIGNPDLLAQVFANLMTNAREAMPDGGQLRLGADLASDGRIEVSVEDTGVGISPEALLKVYDLYFTTKPDGTGVGLSVVYRIVQLHGGEVQIESEPGRGTRVAVRLPSAAVSGSLEA
jgi:signal transduction histidine kinase